MDGTDIKQIHRKDIESLGLEYGGHLIPENFNNDRRVVKVNLPEFYDAHSWETGNGEGCWAYIKREEDYEKYDTGVGEFEVILLNDSLYYMEILYWGTVILVEGRGPKNRPVIKREWITPFVERFINDPTE